MDEEATQKLPKSFVFKRCVLRGPCACVSLHALPLFLALCRGHVGKVVRGLLDNVRETMEPNTARSLQERKSNNIRDFVHVAGPLGVTHFLVFNSTLHGAWTDAQRSRFRRRMRARARARGLPAWLTRVALQARICALSAFRTARLCTSESSASC